MSHRLPKLSFLFPEVEDFLRNSLFPREVIYTAIIFIFVGKLLSSAEVLSLVGSSSDENQQEIKLKLC